MLETFLQFSTYPIHFRIDLSASNRRSSSQWYFSTTRSLPFCGSSICQDTRERTTNNFWYEYDSTNIILIWNILTTQCAEYVRVDDRVHAHEKRKKSTCTRSVVFLVSIRRRRLLAIINKTFIRVTGFCTDQRAGQGEYKSHKTIFRKFSRLQPFQKIIYLDIFLMHFAGQKRFPSNGVSYVVASGTFCIFINSSRCWRKNWIQTSPNGHVNVTTIDFIC